MRDAPTPIVVFVHVHYPEIWRDISALLAERLALPFHLVLTSSHPQYEIVPPRTPALLSSRFQPVENRGRDILPFLRALAQTDNFEIGLKLHTKKSPQREDGSGWRTEVLDSLLPPAPADRAIVAGVQADRRIGLVTPAGFCLSVRPAINMNRPIMHRVMSTLGTDLAEGDLDDAFFAAGSMFWFRRSALAPLTDPKLPELFEVETGQLDGTTAHAVERLFPVVARRQGYLSLAMPALTASWPGMPSIELRELARRHADVPSRYFPAPTPPAASPPAAAAPPPSSGAWALLKSVYRASLPLWLRYNLRLLLGRKRPGWSAPRS
jgi:lipopolysaccharide biosynthesis protein